MTCKTDKNAIEITAKKLKNPDCFFDLELIIESMRVRYEKTKKRIDDMYEEFEILRSFFETEKGLHE